MIQGLDNSKIKKIIQIKDFMEKDYILLNWQDILLKQL